MVDAVEIELFKNRFTSIAEEMGEVLTRTAFSPNIRERRDHSCAMFDVHGEMFAQAAHIPVHLGAAPLCVKAVIAAMQLRPGQTAVVNDPYTGGTHLPDITLVQGVWVDGQAEPVGWVAIRAHHADVGGIAPGSLPPSRHIDDEGWRVAPCLLTPDVVGSLCAASRTPDERRADLAAQQAALALGERRLVELCGRWGRARVAEMMEAVQAYTCRWMRAALASFPVRRAEARDSLDNAFEGGPPVPLYGVVDWDGARLLVDLTGCPDQVDGPMNAPRAIAESAVFYVLMCLLPEGTPANSGVMRDVEVRTRRGSVVDPVYPAPVAAGNVETSQRLVDLLFQAFGHFRPMPACGQGTMNNVLLGSVPGAARSWVMYETIGGGYGAGPESSGASCVQVHMTNTLNTPIEALELVFPVRVACYERRDGSGGRGEHSGGDGLARAFEALEPMVATVIMERRTAGPPGAAGGAAGEPGAQWIDGRRGRRPLESKSTVELAAGDVLWVLTPGGGGWGHS
jgi:N-methylhydantoinase B